MSNAENIQTTETSSERTQSVRTQNERTQNNPIEAAGAAAVAPAWAEPSAYYAPRVDVAENGDAYLFQADLPGARAEDVDVGYQDGTLTLHARVRQRWPQGARPVWSEYGLGHYHRSFDLGSKVDPDGIKAELRDGVLSLYVPKAESAKARKIRVQGA